MSKRMIIDASHPEETRVVVLDGQKVEEFDFEAAAKRPLKGNIYLAKVTRVEPSLQAAFVEYGGNRQGFLAFAEIHPDYYQIPIADRIALLAEQEAEARSHADDDIEAVETTSVPAQESAANAAALSQDMQQGDYFSQDESQHEDISAPSQSEADSLGETSQETAALPVVDSSQSGAIAPSDNPVGMSDKAGAPEPVRTSAAPDTPHQSKLQAIKPPNRWARKRHYKIQEVVKRRQVILVQVVKEERGNKGAALTTYLSLAGRYCVLMPNTPRGGGISRKITSATDRNRLKSAAQSLELPEGMGLIIRTAGENRTKAEIKRDYEYLLRMWDTIRDLTLKSNAPACVYEEGDLIKRAIRDLYNKDVSEIVVEGDDGYRNAKDFMRMLMPSHAKNVKPYKEPIPLFQSYQIESQLDAMFTPTVTLKSGGYLVINQTEALVSIDVNSGRATREHSIEDTAYKTNLEAADEVARQLRLRDLAGLIVIDFIDMEDPRNDRNVEKRLRDSVKNDRARVQIGKISQFGLLEMSRQRLRAGVVAGSTVPCPHCGGQGIVRSVESTALRLLRNLEEEAQKQRAAILGVHAATEVVIYALNQKRKEIAHIESEYDLLIQFNAKDGEVAGAFEIERIGQRAPEDLGKHRTVDDRAMPIQAALVTDVTEITDDTPEVEVPPRSESEEGGSTVPSKRRRRRRRGRDRAPVSVAQESTPTVSDAPPRDSGDELRIPPLVAPSSNPPSADPTISATQGRKRRRRRRGRRGSRENGAIATSGGLPPGADVTSPTVLSSSDDAARNSHDAGAAAVPQISVPVFVPNSSSDPVWSLSSDEASPVLANPPNSPSGRAEPSQSVGKAERSVRAITDNEQSAEVRPGAPAEPPRKGWWQRPFRSKD